MEAAKTTSKSTHGAEEKKNRLDQKILIVECDEAALNVCCSLFYFFADLGGAGMFSDPPYTAQ